MNAVTIASIAYIATQVCLTALPKLNCPDAPLKVRFALSSSSVFSRTDTSTDSETFYHSLLDLLEDPEESKEVDELLTWWNRYCFHSSPFFRGSCIVFYPVKYFLRHLLPSGLSAPTVLWRRSDSDALQSNRLQILILRSLHWSRF